MKRLRNIAFGLLLGLGTFGVFAQSNSYFMHTVTKGQGLYSIARMYNVSETDIVALNPGSERVIKAGQTLKIPQKEKNNATGTRYHTIKPGETLYRLTVIYQLSAKTICEANPGLSAENFKEGQVIVIPQVPNTSVETASNQGITLTPVQNGPALQKKKEVQTSENGFQLKPVCKTEHTTKRKETLYSISRRYGISEKELIAVNPGLKNGKLKKGEVLCIPYSQKELARQAELREKQQKELQQKLQEKQEQTLTDEILFEQNKPEVVGIEQIKVAIILPFLLDEDSTTVEQQKMVEYYEGFLLAVDSLKHAGISIDLHVYDSGNQLHSLKNLLALKEMKEMNIIFGPMYDNHIAEVAAFAKENHIEMVVPFARNVDQVFNNPYVYQINTPQSYFYSEVNEHFFREFKNPNVLFFESVEESDNPFASNLKRELQHLAIPFTVLPADTSSNSHVILEHCQKDRENILLMTSSESGSLNTMIPIFQLVARDTLANDFNIHLFGYPEYQVYTNNHLASFYEIDTYFYTSFYTNNLLPQAVNFHKLFRRTYNKDIVNRYPKYALLGFDTGFYFLQALSLYGSDFENKLESMSFDPIQTGFKFERVNNWGGFVNKKAFFIHLSKDFELSKIDFD